jgi:hypothetical protein
MTEEVEIHHKTIEHIRDAHDHDLRHLIILLIKKGIITVDEFHELPYHDLGESE